MASLSRDGVLPRQTYHGDELWATGHPIDGLQLLPRQLRRLCIYIYIFKAGIENVTLPLFLTHRYVCHLNL